MKTYKDYNRILDKDGDPKAIFWTEIGEVEASAYKQVIDMTLHPCLYKYVAIMPDVHAGIGATIGSVLALEEAVIPSAVGVDIGCVDSETEFLSPTGWIKISEYKPGQKIMETTANGSAKFTEPVNFIKKPVDKFYHIKSKYGIDMCLSPEHKISYFQYTRKYDFMIQRDISCTELVEHHTRTKEGFRGRFNTTFTPALNTSMNITNAELRVMVMVMADGHLCKKSRNQKCILQFKKLRKKQRAELLLNDANIEYKYSANKNNCYYFAFRSPLNTKTFGDFWDCSLAQLRIISDEAIYWDGNQKDRVYYTRDKASADFMQYAFSASGLRGRLLISHRTSGTDYRVFANANTKIGINGTPKTKILEYHKHNGYQYCFTTNTGYWIMRRNGCIVITGNCGMGACKTNFNLDNIDHKEMAPMLSRLMKDISEKIPMGFSHRSQEQIKMIEPITDKYKDFLLEAETLSAFNEHRHSVVSQLGTLGGGNHFIELQKTSDGKMAIMLHSGSRNFGYTIANKWIKHAAALKNAPTDLEFFDISSEDGMRYILGMNMALTFAFINRKAMLFIIKNVLSYHLPGITFEDTVNIHHNYVAPEEIDGHTIYVHRKGATKISPDITGIIPGSMGTPSYIVTGKPEAVESYWSCSHGAGRTMSRSKAKKNISAESFTRAMTGIVTNATPKLHLDEAPRAYKNIDTVMADQDGLVSILDKRIPIMNMKG